MVDRWDEELLALAANGPRCLTDDPGRWNRGPGSRMGKANCGGVRLTPPQVSCDNTNLMLDPAPEAGSTARAASPPGLHPYAQMESYVVHSEAFQDLRALPLRSSSSHQ